MAYHDREQNMAMKGVKQNIFDLEKISLTLILSMRVYVFRELF